jgi:hypothetical protein
LHIRVQQPFGQFHDLVEQALGDNFGVDPRAFFADRETALWRGADLFFIMNALPQTVMQPRHFHFTAVIDVVDLWYVFHGDYLSSL